MTRFAYAFLSIALIALGLAWHCFRRQRAFDAQDAADVIAQAECRAELAEFMARKQYDRGFTDCIDAFNTPGAASPKKNRK